jgi:hypothetical protein
MTDNSHFSTEPYSRLHALGAEWVRLARIAVNDAPDLVALIDDYFGGLLCRDYIEADPLAGKGLPSMVEVTARMLVDATWSPFKPGYEEALHLLLTQPVHAQQDILGHPGDDAIRQAVRTVRGDAQRPWVSAHTLSAALEPLRPADDQYEHRVSDWLRASCQRGVLQRLSGPVNHGPLKGHLIDHDGRIQPDYDAYTTNPVWYVEPHLLTEDLLTSNA